jgi:hypothetical protein
MADLESRNRRLVWAYPKRYRTQRGPELLTTLLDGARPGQTRPTGHEVKDLVLGGLRCRLRVPGKGAAVFAVFLAFAAGTPAATLGWTPALAAALGAWLLTGYAARRLLVASYSVRSAMIIPAVIGLVVTLLAEAAYLTSGGLMAVAAALLGIGALLLALLVAAASAPWPTRRASASDSTSTMASR